MTFHFSIMEAQIYTTSTCAYCETVKKYLTGKGVSYVVMDADQPEIREEAMRISGAMTVPVTKIGESVIVGWQPAELAKAIREA